MRFRSALTTLAAAGSAALALASGDRPAWKLACPSTMDADQLLADVDLSGKVFVVTGDGHIASAVDLALARRNATVVLGCRKPAGCASLKSQIESEAGAGRVETGTLDLSSREIIRSFAADVARRHAHVDGLVNMAAIDSTHMSHDGFVLTMEVNLLGPAYLADLLLPRLRASAAFPQPGRVVNVGAEVAGSHPIPANATVDTLAAWCTHVDTALNTTGAYVAASKLLMIHHAVELGQREKGSVAAFAVNPGYSLEFQPAPQWLLYKILKLPESVLKWAYAHAGTGVLAYILRMKKACETNFKGLGRCPEPYNAAAAVVVAAAAAPGIEGWSGSWLDFDARPLPQSAPQIFGPYELHEPNCVPRTPPPMEAGLRAAWFDRMLAMMKGNRSAGGAAWPQAAPSSEAGAGLRPSAIVI